MAWLVYEPKQSFDNNARELGWEREVDTHEIPVRL